MAKKFVETHGSRILEQRNEAIEDIFQPVYLHCRYF